MIAAMWALQVLRYKLPAFPLQVVIASLWRMALAALVMAEVVWVVARCGRMPTPARARLCGWSCRPLVGAAVYVGMLLVLESPELDDVRSRLRPAPTSIEAE